MLNYHQEIFNFSHYFFFSKSLLFNFLLHALSYNISKKVSLFCCWDSSMMHCCVLAWHTFYLRQDVTRRWLMFLRVRDKRKKPESARVCVFGLVSCFTRGHKYTYLPTCLPAVFISFFLHARHMMLINCQLKRTCYPTYYYNP